MGSKAVRVYRLREDDQLEWRCFRRLRRMFLRQNRSRMGVRRLAERLIRGLYESVLAFAVCWMLGTVTATARN